MGIFRHDDGTRLIEDFHVGHRSHVQQHIPWVVVAWKVMGARPVEVALLRCESGHAERLEELLEPHTPQVLVYNGSDTRFQDQGVDPGVDYHYTIFAEAPDGSWHKQDHAHVKTGAYDDGQVHLVDFDQDYQRSYFSFVDKVWPGFRDEREDFFPGTVPERWLGREDADSGA